MTYIDDLRVIYNVQVWFRENFIDDLPNDSDIWSREFRKWLADQGCEIDNEVSQATRMIRNSLGLAPGYDRFKFNRNEDAVIFVLRWS